MSDLLYETRNNRHRDSPDNKMGNEEILSTSLVPQNTTGSQVDQFKHTKQRNKVIILNTSTHLTLTEKGT
jgi:hypothetical protein